MTDQRKKYILDKLIEIYNNHTLPRSITWGAVEIEMMINSITKDKDPEEMYQKLQIEIADYLLKDKEIEHV